MKKLLIIFTSFSFFLALAGCDLLPEDAIELSEQYCRDNPESEICSGDLLPLLEDEVIENLFTEIYENYTDLDNTTFCDDYFSITNPTVLDYCRDSREDLFPVDFAVTGFDSVTTTGDNVYQIVVPNTSTSTYTFTVELTEVDGNMFVVAWSYVVNETPVIEVSEEDGLAFFIQFIADDENPSISSETFCATYILEHESSLCINGRDERLANEVTVSIDTFTKSGNTFIISLVASEKHREDIFYVMIITLDYNLTGDIEIEVAGDYRPEDNVTFEDFYRGVIAEFHDSDMNPLDFCNTYYVEDSFDLCEVDFDDLKDYDLSISIEEFIDIVGLYTVTLNYDYPATSGKINKTITHHIQFIYDEDQIKIYITHNDDFYAEPDYASFMADYVIDYQDTSISNQDFCTTYMTTDDYSDCIHRRQAFIDGEYYLSLGHFYTYTGNPYFIKFLYTGAVHYYVEEFEATFEIDEDGNIKVVFEYESETPIITYDDAENFMEDFVMDLTDTNISTSIFLTRFIYTDSHDIFADIREEVLSTGSYVVTYSIYQVDETEWKLDIFFSDEKIYFYDAVFHRDNDVLTIELLPISAEYTVNVDDIHDLLEDYTNSINEDILDITSICTSYFTVDSQDSCFEEVSNIRENNLVVSTYNLTSHTNYITVTYRYTDSDGVETYVDINLDFFPQYYSHNYIKMSYESQENYVSYESKLYILNLFETEFNSTASTDETACSLMSTPESYTLCEALHQEFKAADLKLFVQTQNFSKSPHTVDFSVFNNQADIEYYITMNVKFNVDGEGVITFELSNISKFKIATSSETTAYMTELIDTFNSDEITNEEFCTEYESLFDLCIDYRENFKLRGEILGIQMIAPFENSITSFMIILSVQQEDNYSYDEISVWLTFYKNLDNELVVSGTFPQYHDPINLAAIDAIMRGFMELHFDNDIDLHSVYQYMDENNIEASLGDRDLLASTWTFVSMSPVTIETYSPNIVFGYDLTLNDGETISVFHMLFTLEHSWYGIATYSFDTFDYSDLTSVEEFTTTFIAILQNGELSPTEFCSIYHFESVDSVDCEDFYTQIIESGYSVSLNDNSDNYGWYSIEINFYDNETYISSIMFDVNISYNILGEVSSKLYVNFFGSAAGEAINDFFDPLFEGLNNNTLTGEDLCTIYEICEPAFQMDREVFNIDIELIQINLESIFSPSISFYFVYYFDNQSLESEMNVFNMYWTTVDDEIVVSLEFVSSSIYIPLDDTNLELTDSEIALLFDNYIADVQDDTLSNSELCEIYFRGTYPAVECFPNRDKILTETPTITYSTILIEENYYTTYTTTITIDYGDEVETVEYYFIVNETADETEIYLLLLNLIYPKES